MHKGKGETEWKQLQQIEFLVISSFRGWAEDKKQANAHTCTVSTFMSAKLLELQSECYSSTSLTRTTSSMFSSRELSRGVTGPCFHAIK